MRRRQPLPRLWLMTDERLGDRLLTAVRALPRGAGVVFRHHATPAGERRRLFRLVQAEARRRGMRVVLAGSAGQAAGWRADGVHGRAAERARRGGLRTWPAHCAREIVAGVRAGADVVFLSPAFATRSHPGERVLGVVRFGLLARSCPHPGALFIALGGMGVQGYRRLRPLGAEGWAGIDALAPDQKRKVVPR